MKTKEDYINYKLKKAEEALKEAQLLLENNFGEASISRLYYAAFYAINALLINLDLNPKTHQGVKSLFHKEFIYTKKLDEEFSDFYTLLMAKRHEADYENFSFINKEKIPDYIIKTRQLIDLAKQQIASK